MQNDSCSSKYDSIYISIVDCKLTCVLAWINHELWWSTKYWWAVLIRLPIVSLALREQIRWRSLTAWSPSRSTTASTRKTASSSPSTRPLSSFWHRAWWWLFATLTSSANCGSPLATCEFSPTQIRHSKQTFDCSFPCSDLRSPPHLSTYKYR